MSDLDLDAFSKKYSFAINGLEMRAKTGKGAKALARELYNDAIQDKVNMEDLTLNLKLFYQGNVFGQRKLSNYVEKYK